MIIKCIFSLAAIVLACHSPAEVVRSMLGARGAIMSASAWKNPYITDGLVAMWDGEWNAGGGRHDANATVWKDLAGDVNLASEGGNNWSEKYLNVSEGWTISGADILSGFVNAPKVAGGGYTAEIVCVVDSTTGRNVVGAKYSNFSIFLNNTKIYAWLGNGNDTRSSSSEGLLSLTTFTTERGVDGKNTDKSYSNSILSNTYTGRTYIGAPITSFGVGKGEYPAWGIATGKYYSIRLYSKVLSGEEMRINYAVDKARFNLP